MAWKGLLLVLCLFLNNCTLTRSLSSSVGSTNQRTKLVRDLQSCFTPQDILHRVGKHVSPQVDPSGELARLVLVRLSKQWIVKDNQNMKTWWQEDPSTTPELLQILDSIVHSLLCTAWAPRALSSSSHDESMDTLVEATKACSTISRLVPAFSTEAIRSFFDKNAVDLTPGLKDHEISGLVWALESMTCTERDLHTSSSSSSSSIPPELRHAWENLHLPFRIAPGMLSAIHTLSVSTMQEEVDFRTDQIRTATKKVVNERRETAWQGDDGVAPFEYGGKSMPTQEWTPIVQCVRDVLSDPVKGNGQYYDCCLLNYYVNGGSGMRYHIDPDQGSLWDYDTCVVSIGATRRFSFRKIPSNTNRDIAAEPPHTFVVMHGDVAHMFDRCQDEYQHCVKKAENKADDSARVSLVFKRSWGIREAKSGPEP